MVSHVQKFRPRKRVINKDLTGLPFGFKRLLICYLDAMSDWRGEGLNLEEMKRIKARCKEVLDSGIYKENARVLWHYQWLYLSCPDGTDPNYYVRHGGRPHYHP